MNLIRSLVAPQIPKNKDFDGFHYVNYIGNFNKKSLISWIFQPNQIHIELCNHLINFKISLDHLILSIDHGKNTFDCILASQTPETIFDIFLGNVCPEGCAHLYMEMERGSCSNRNIFRTSSVHF